MKPEYIEPSMIEKKSFEIIEEQLKKTDVIINGDRPVCEENDPDILSVIKRCIHTTADLEYARTMCFSDGAVEKLRLLVKDGATIVCDTNMALSGINKRVLERYGCSVYCFMADPEVARQAKERKVTRAQVSMELAMSLPGPVIFVVGNAPTALMTLKEHYDSGDYTPAFVVGVPVGFVNVVAAKELIMGSSVPYIVNSGQKGGSNVAAAIVNACLYGMREEGRAATFGFTTGTCAAAAAKAATFMLLSQKMRDHIGVDTPSGIRYDTPLEDVMLTKNSASCAVRKPESDDPDITAGIRIYAKSELVCDGKGNVIIEGGKGIGKLTRPGLDRPVGDWAINSVPRKMITREVMSTAEEYEYSGSVRIVISAPEGEEIAKKTFNPRFGIEGGISIIGTSGLVEPMSTKALVDTIRAELAQKRALKDTIAVITPGNYGADFMSEHFSYDLNRAVKCSNYPGETIDIAKDLGFEALLLVGHAGKLVKLAGGIMNTHSAMADCRMELMAASAVRAGADHDTAMAILDSVSTEEAYGYMKSAGIADRCFELIMEKIAYNLQKRAREMRIECMVYSTVYGLIGATKGAYELMEAAK